MEIIVMGFAVIGTISAIMLMVEFLIEFVIIPELEKKITEEN